MKKQDDFTSDKAEHSYLHPNSTEAQRNRLLAALKSSQKGITTIEARESLDVIAPAPRIHELRHTYDLNIQTIWDIDIDVLGRKHRVARYFLFPGKWSDAV